MAKLRFRPSPEFNRNLKKLAKLDRSIVSEVREAIDVLLDMNSLPKEFNDHQLSYQLSDYREFHIRDTPKGGKSNPLNDIIVTYSINYGDLIVTAINIGTHDEMFGDN